LWFILNLQYLLGHGFPERSVRMWTECHVAIDAHVASIWGLWLLDLGRRLPHQSLPPNAFRQKMACWNHAKEKKLLAALQSGDFRGRELSKRGAVGDLVRARKALALLQSQ
jgi:hypothetical protein